MSRPFTFELCAETLQACLAAVVAGADRIELCSYLEEDGLTPDFVLMHQAAHLCRLPLHIMLRPRSGDFVYSALEFREICKHLELARQLGAAGFVCGILRPNGTVDIDRMRQLTAMAGTLPVTFHRALDQTSCLEDALEDIIASGSQRVLTSGGAPTAMEGTSVLARLIAQAGDRIQVAVGSGLKLENAAILAQKTGASHFHGTLRTSGTNTVDPMYVKAVIAALSCSSAGRSDHTSTGGK